MAGIKEIRTRIKSVEQTLKITNAMYLISSANLRKAKGRLDNTVPYFTKIFKTIAHILHHSPELEHDFFDQRPDVEPQARRVGYIVVTGDKGLAGAYSHNVLKLAQQRVEGEKNLSLFLVGIVGRVYCQNRDIPFEEDFNYVAQNPTKLPQIRRFLNYYLPPTLKLLNAYDRMDSAGVSGANIDGTKGRVENIMDTIVKSFDQQLDALFGDEALDISTDITVLEQMLAREGLGGTQMPG